MPPTERQIEGITNIFWYFFAHPGGNKKFSIINIFQKQERFILCNPGYGIIVVKRQICFHSCKSYHTLLQGKPLWIAERKYWGKKVESFFFILKGMHEAFLLYKFFFLFLQDVELSLNFHTPVYRPHNRSDGISRICGISQYGRQKGLFCEKKESLESFLAVKVNFWSEYTYSWKKTFI